MRFSFLAAAASLLTAFVAYAQQPPENNNAAVKPTDPIASTKWKAGATATVKWELTDKYKGNALTIRLYHGDPAHFTEDAVLGTAPAGSTSFKVNVPANLKSDWYSIRVGDDDSYSHPFLIEGTGPLPTGGPPTAAPATPTAAPTTAPASSVVPTTARASATATVTKPATASPTGAAGSLKAGSMAIGAAALVAAALAF
ncbi:hypothetical protein BGW42_005767 [Actinomortierella wolfii]|nr:hypothetical protein BGW42_005767 [Actinomortierella wolfii]